jgi:hypothetical protein
MSGLYFEKRGVKNPCLAVARKPFVFQEIIFIHIEYHTIDIIDETDNLS